MTWRGRMLAAMLALGVSGCESTQEMLNDEAGAAMQAAVQRGRFELACPTAQGTVLSSNLLQPIAWRGQERAEFTIGVSGCGKRATYVSVCPLASPSCFAARSGALEIAQ